MFIGVNTFDIGYGLYVFGIHFIADKSEAQKTGLLVPGHGSFDGKIALTFK